MNIISFYEIIELNRILQDKELHFRIHIRDACGGQSFWIEPLGNCACDGHYEEMYSVLEEYFKSKNISIEYADDKLQFWTV